jgi:hypothetical protein
MIIISVKSLRLILRGWPGRNWNSSACRVPRKFSRVPQVWQPCTRQYSTTFHKAVMLLFPRYCTWSCVTEYHLKSINALMNYLRIMRLYALMAASMKVITFWDMTQCSLVEVYRRFRGTNCLPPLSGRWSPWWLTTRLRGCMFQKTVIFCVPFIQLIKKGNKCSSYSRMSSV